MGSEPLSKEPTTAPCPRCNGEDHEVFDFLGMPVYACPEMDEGTYAIVPGSLPEPVADPDYQGSPIIQPRRQW